MFLNIIKKLKINKTLFKFVYLKNNIINKKNLKFFKIYQ